jgi:hypothetical protein
MLRALYHATALAYYAWALNRNIDPAHPEAGFVQTQHALHSIELRRFLAGR